MVRIPLSSQQRDAGRRLGESVRLARGSESMVAVAARCGLSVDTVRKIETGRVPTPAFATVAILARAVGLSLDLLAADLHPDVDSAPAVRTRLTEIQLVS